MLRNDFPNGHQIRSYARLGRRKIKLFSAMRRRGFPNGAQWCQKSFQGYPETIFLSSRKSFWKSWTPFSNHFVQFFCCRCSKKLICLFPKGGPSSKVYMYIYIYIYIYIYTFIYFFCFVVSLCCFFNIFDIHSATFIYFNIIQYNIY